MGHSWAKGPVLFGPRSMSKKWIKRPMNIVRNSSLSDKVEGLTELRLFLPGSDRYRLRSNGLEPCSKRALQSPALHWNIISSLRCVYLRWLVSALAWVSSTEVPFLWTAREGFLEGVAFGWEMKKRKLFVCRLCL